MKSTRCAPYNHGVSLTKIDLHAVMVGIEDVLPPRPVVAESAHGLRKSAPEILAGAPADIRDPDSASRRCGKTQQLRQSARIVLMSMEEVPIPEPSPSSRRNSDWSCRVVVVRILLTSANVRMDRGHWIIGLPKADRSCSRHAGDGDEQGTCSLRCAPQCPPNSGRQPPLDNGWHGVSASALMRDWELSASRSRHDLL